MNVVHSDFTPKSRDARVDKIIKLAIMAVGGQGGGVLTNWIEEVARNNGYAAQATSVAGVAQRTGATIYYIEMAPDTGRQPVFSLMPAAGDVDILLAAEMMEAGRAIQRGFVTPDRTTLIASSHRALAVSEKMVPGDGIANSEEVKAAAEIAAQRFIVFDMNKMAVDAGSVISASLFGALAGSATLPFTREQFEAAIRAGGRGVDASLRAFAAAFEATQAGAEQPTQAPEPAHKPLAITGPDALIDRWNALTARIDAYPAPVRDMARRGLRVVVDFQDIDYGEDYLGRLDAILAVDRADKEYALTEQAAKYVAKAMAYDDVIRVADLKTRASRFERIHDEMHTPDEARLMLTEFMHPRAEEIVGMFPARIGRRIEADARWMRRIDRLFNKGRRVRTDRLTGFVPLYVLGGLKGWRRRTLRHAYEVEHLERWLATAMDYLKTDYDLAVEVLRTRRLIKGYSDTHARGLSKFDRVIGAIALLAGRDDAAEWAARLREAALKDEEGKMLDGAIETVRSFVPEKAEMA
ncbi:MULTISPECIES: indolepyruvate oxidoreductase subunit beta family protein [unclassified Roseitalea]|uniref:indolepyruvate oxidoreductase subunit beta family protein n=1 Tax=unclassified Roseitalea TaxID=2639107 RepID=UPI00273F43C6|nr:MULTISPECIES: indolepyruvate oxidoreductase subunit beta family protein [unclassified Roseitalea]